MSYDYATQRANIFTEEGQIMFLRIRDQTKTLLETAGACRMREMTRNSSWDALACVDRLVELGEIREITETGVAGQYRVFVRARGE